MDGLWDILIANPNPPDAKIISPLVNPAVYRNNTEETKTQIKPDQYWHNNKCANTTQEEKYKNTSGGLDEIIDIHDYNNAIRQQAKKDRFSENAHSKFDNPQRSNQR